MSLLVWFFSIHLIFSDIVFGYDWEMRKKWANMDIFSALYKSKYLEAFLLCINSTNLFRFLSFFSHFQKRFVRIFLLFFFFRFYRIHPCFILYIWHWNYTVSYFDCVYRKRNNRAWGEDGKWQAEESEKTPDHLLQLPARRPAEAVSEHTVSGAAGESRAGRITGTHANAGEILHHSISCNISVLNCNYFNVLNIWNPHYFKIMRFDSVRIYAHVYGWIIVP